MPLFLSKVEQEPLLTNLTIQLNLNQQEKLANGEDLSQDIIKQVVNDKIEGMKKQNSYLKYKSFIETKQEKQ